MVVVNAIQYGISRKAAQTQPEKAESVKAEKAEGKKKTTKE